MGIVISSEVKKLVKETHWDESYSNSAHSDQKLLAWGKRGSALYLYQGSQCTPEGLHDTHAVHCVGAGRECAAERGLLLCSG